MAVQHMTDPSEWTEEEAAAIKADVEQAMAKILANHVLRKCLKDSPLFGMLAEGWGPNASAHFATGGVVSLKSVMGDCEDNEFVIPRPSKKEEAI